MTAEAELISLADTVFNKLGFKIIIRVNNRKLMNSYLKAAGVKEDNLSDAILSIDKLEKFGVEAVKKELAQKKITKAAIDKIIDIVSIKGTNKQKITKISKIVKEADGLNEIKELLEYCNAMKVDIMFDLSLARGLSYYTGTIYEIFLKNSSIKSAVCSGGRYDDMIDNFLDSKGRYPAVGISFGLDRLYDAYLEKNKEETKSVAKVFIIPIKTVKESLDIAKQLRNSGINTDIDILSRGPSKNLDFANALGIPYCLFIGPKELEAGKVKLRDMKTGDEKLLTVKKAMEEIK
jgi:histidyl-tRNA synthetase